MAKKGGKKKKNRELVKLVAKNPSGKITHMRHTMKNKKNDKDRLKFNKYNPVTRKYEEYVEK